MCHTFSLKISHGWFSQWIFHVLFLKAQIYCCFNLVIEPGSWSKCTSATDDKELSKKKKKVLCLFVHFFSHRGQFSDVNTVFLNFLVSWLWNWRQRFKIMIILIISSNDILHWYSALQFAKMLSCFTSHRFLRSVRL